MNPNSEQQKLIESTEGVYLVDAGAGTGKTFSITRRYVNLLEDAEPGEIFLATFTRNAAEEMSARIAERADRPSSEIYEAPISTFHAHCRDLLRRNGFNAPGLLGIDATVPSEIGVLESRIRELQEFSRFMETFRSDHPEYSHLYRVARQDSELLDLVKSLASKGVIPESTGWFRDTEKYLDGSAEEFERLFRQANSPQKTENGEKQSELRRRLYSMKWKNFTPDAPEMDEVRGDRGTKQVRRDFCRKAFEQDREELKSFVHDLYLEYMEYCLDRSYLNFSFIMAFAFVLLHEDPEVRSQESFRYVMVDEFQDTNEIQFKLALLMAEEPNIAAVGDWKQSIYSFQHASVDNILEFESRLDSYVRELNTGGNRVGFGPPEVERISLKRNYRSSQGILDAAEKGLSVPAHARDDPDVPDTVGLDSQVDTDCTVEKFTSEDEAEAVLTRAVELVQEGETHGGDDLGYGDVAVLARTRNLGLEMQKKAEEMNVPVAYEGGVELFTTRPALLSLAWLRILAWDAPGGWAVVLEEAGYTLAETGQMLNEAEYPDSMEEFRQRLKGTDSITGAVSMVLDRYGETGLYADRLLEVLGDTFSSSSMNLPGIIEFMEENIEQGETYQVEEPGREERITVQTIHAAKGLEYPAVFVAGLNQSVFPSTNSDTKPIRLMGPAGLRQTSRYRKDEHAFIYDSWRAEIISKCLSGEYDEERRLLYVAMTRAEKYLFLSATEGSESSFYTGIDVPETEVQPGVEGLETPEVEETEPEFETSSSSPGLTEISSISESIPAEDVQAAMEGEDPGGIQAEIREYVESQEGDIETGVGFVLPEGDGAYRGKTTVLKMEDGCTVLEFARESERPADGAEKKLRAARKALQDRYGSSLETRLVYL